MIHARSGHVNCGRAGPRKMPNVKQDTLGTEGVAIAFETDSNEMAGVPISRGIQRMASPLLL